MNARGNQVRCKPGDRCRIVAPATNEFHSPNIGRIVMVVRPYRAGETIGEANDWVADGADGGRHWVVASLGDGLRCYSVVNGRPNKSRTVMTMPISDHRLVPLDDDEGGVEASVLRCAPRPLVAAAESPSR